MARLAPKAKVHYHPLYSVSCFVLHEYLMCLLSPCRNLNHSCTALFLLMFGQVLRDGRWTEEEAAILVPGDIVSIKLGDIIPADARLLEGDPLKIDQVLPIVITC